MSTEQEPYLSLLTAPLFNETRLRTLPQTMTSSTSLSIAELARQRSDAAIQAHQG